MGLRGNPPVPTAILKLRGSQRAAKRTKEPQPKVEGATCPEWLSAEAKTEWRRIVPELRRLGLLTLVDRTALAAYCQAHAELRLATETVDKEGRVIEEPIVDKEGDVVGHKLKPHPAVKMQRDAMQRIKQFIAEFGLSPSARARVTPIEQPGKSGSAWDEVG